MRILLVHNSYQEAGGEDVVFEQERQLLDRAGHKVLLYRRSNREILAYNSLQKLLLVKKVVWAAEAKRAFRELLARERPEIVHVHNTFAMISPSIYSACREANIPVVQTLHNYRLLCPAANLFRDGKICEECLDRSLWRGPRYGCYRGSRAMTGAVSLMLAVHRYQGTWTEMVDCYVALTEFGRRKFIAAGLPEAKVRVKPHFVYPDPGERSGDGDYALFVGRLSSEKGARTLAAAWQKLPRSIPLRIVGDGSLERELKTTVAQCGLSNVSFEGRRPRHQTLSAMMGARVLIFPSLCYEGLPMTIIESYACGVPVIASEMGAMQEIVHDRRTGLQFRPSDPEALAEKVAWAWSHPQQMRSMGKEARAEYERQYTAKANYGMLMDIYERCLAGTAQTATAQVFAA